LTRRVKKQMQSNESPLNFVKKKKTLLLKKLYKTRKIQVFMNLKLKMFVSHYFIYIENNINKLCFFKVSFIHVSFNIVIT